MSIRAREQLDRFLFAIVIGLLGAMLTSPAWAQDLNPGFKLPSVSDFYTSGALAVVLVGLTVRALRKAFSDVLAPKVPTKTSKNLTLLASLVSGVLWSLGGVGVQIAPGLHGWILGGLAIGALAFTGAGAIGTKARGEKHPVLGEIAGPS